MSVYLSKNHYPHVKLNLRNDKKTIKVDCLIDTGFSSGIALSQRLQSKLRLAPVARQDFEMADGSIVSFDVYLVNATYNNVKKKLVLVFTKSDDNLVGMEFLDGFRFLLDLKGYKIVLD